MLIDMHSHSTLSDGTLSIEEMVAAADRRGYQAYAVTDHANSSDPAYRDVVTAVRAEVERLRRQVSLHLFAGAELTEFDPGEIAKVAAEVRRCGAEVVVVHGECVSMPVPPGTNSAAVRADGIDILAHPGLLSEEDAEVAARRGVFVEISARQGHNWANGHVYRTARKANAPIIVDSDAHDESGLLSEPKVTALLRGAGASELSTIAIQNQLAPTLINHLLRRVDVTP